MSQYQGFRVRGWTIDFTRFGIAEMSKLVGMSVHKLVEVRKAHHLPGQWSPLGNFTSRDVAEIAVRCALAERGIPFVDSDEVGCEAAKSILWHAGVHHDRVFEVVGTRVDVSRCLDTLSENTKAIGDLTALVRPWLCIRMANGEMKPSVLQTAGCKERNVCDVDLAAISGQMVRKLGRPLFTIEASGDTPLRKERRLSRAVRHAARFQVGEGKVGVQPLRAVA